MLHFGPRAYTPDQVNAWAATSSAEKVARRCADGRLVLIAIDEGGQYLGFGELEHDGHLDFLYIAPEAGGVASHRHIYDALEAYARGRAMRRLFVEASELARPLLERRGFVIRARNELALDGVNSTTSAWRSSYRYQRERCRKGALYATYIRLPCDRLNAPTSIVRRWLVRKAPYLSDVLLGVRST